MASKMQCPACGYVLKEEGDETKQGMEYRVYENLSNSKHKSGKYRYIECLRCHHFGEVSVFDFVKGG